MKIQEIFADELTMIHDQKIKNFVLKCFDELCPDYFWTVPCSTSGEYHPKISLGTGGLVRHVKLAVWWGLELIKAMKEMPELKEIPAQQLQDEVVATLLLHDLIKNGEGLGPDGRPLDRSVTGTHGVTLTAKIVNSDVFGDMLESDGKYDRILEGIACHMGVWTTDPNYKPFGDFTYLIHLADYCASRKVDEKMLELTI
jgi:hypothetical protein